MPGQKILFLLLSGLIWALVTFAPNGGAAGDAWGSLLSAQSLLEHGSFDLSPYTDRAAFNDAQFFRRGQAVYYGYPPGTPLLEVPLVAAARLAGLDMTHPAQESFMERQVNALAMVAVLGALYFGLSALFAPRPALLGGFLMLMASVYTGSIASSMANSQMTEIAFLTWSQAWLLHWDRRGGRLSGWAFGLLLGAAYLCRPTALLWSPFAFLYLLLRRRQALPSALLACGLCFLALKLASQPLWGGPHPYYGARILVFDPPLFSLHLIGTLFSPGTGLFVFQSPLLLACALAPLLLRRQLLSWIFFSYALGQMVVVALQTEWISPAFGPRLVAEACFPLWLLLAMAWTRLGRLRWLVWPGLAWSLWLNTWLAFFCSTQHLHYTATRPEQDPTARGLWDWQLAPYRVTQDQLWALARLQPPAIFPALIHPIRRDFEEPERAGDQFFARAKGPSARLRFRSWRPPGRADGLVNVRYTSETPATLKLNGQPLGQLPPSRAAVRRNFSFRGLEWAPENELEFNSGPDFRLFDVVADTAPAGEPGILGLVEGWTGDEDNSRWALGPYSQALLVVRRRARVAIDWQATNPEDDLSVEVWCDGHHRADFNHLPEGEFPLRLELALEAGDHLLEFRFSHWGIDGARDQRPLALRFQNLRLSYSGL